MLPSADFPTVVCEAGWSETFPELLDDARLWLLHTEGKTKIVIVIAFTESFDGLSPEIGDEELRVGNEKTEIEGNKPGVESDKLGVENNETEVESQELGVENDRPEVENRELEVSAKDNLSTSEEQMVLDSIDSTTGFHDLSAKLVDLNRRGKLKEPLLGTLGATVHIYKASEDGKDIAESFKATLLPRPMNEEEEGLRPKGFGVTLGDLLGGSVPEDHNSKDEIEFSLEQLAEFVDTSLPQTVRYKAESRAVKLLREAGEWEERETYAQGKRRRLNQELV